MEHQSNMELVKNRMFFTISSLELVKQMCIGLQAKKIYWTLRSSSNLEGEPKIIITLAQKEYKVLLEQAIVSYKMGVNIVSKGGKETIRRTILFNNNTCSQINKDLELMVSKTYIHVRTT